MEGNSDEHDSQDASPDSVMGSVDAAPLDAWSSRSSAGLASLSPFSSSLRNCSAKQLTDLLEPPTSLVGSSVASEDSLTGCYSPRKQIRPASRPRLTYGNAAPERIRWPPAVWPSVPPIRTTGHDETAPIKRAIEEALMSGHSTPVACEGA